MLENSNLAVILFCIGISFVLVFLNGFFVAAEFAIVKVRRSRLEELAGQGVEAARISILCVDQLDDYLSATQLGITLVSLALGWIGESAFFSLAHYFFPEFFSLRTAHAITAGLAFFLITLLHVVLGELVPKSMAIQKAEKITLLVTPSLRFFYKLAKPLIKTFTYLANLVLRRLGYHNAVEPPLSEEELKIVMRESHEDGIISESEAQIIARAFSFSDKRAIDIMIPTARVEFLDLDRTIDENVAITDESMYTRFPLTQNGSLNNVIGVVHMKDALRALAKDRSNGALEKTARTPVFVNSSTRQDRLMQIFKSRRTHMAIVQDAKTKKNVGIVTLEDVLEDLVGEIMDEHGN
jgi:CBS domain containing-hemolysin-like protein